MNIKDLKIFQILNAAQNKIEKLPPSIGQFIDGTVTLPRKGSKKELFQGPVSVLEEVHIQVRKQEPSRTCRLWIILLSWILENHGHTFVCVYIYIIFFSILMNFKIIYNTLVIGKGFLLISVSYAGLRVSFIMHIYT